MKYPKDYKSNDTRIVKFERNYSQFLEYRFIGLFPISLNSTRVSYNNSQILKATAQFSFDRYVCGESSSLARALGISLNNQKGKDLKATYNQRTANINAINVMMPASNNMLNQRINYDESVRNLPDSIKSTIAGLRQG